MQLEHIEKRLQANVIASFWTMLQECESNVYDDPVLKLWVEGWYKQWNEITGDNRKPRWENE